MANTADETAPDFTGAVSAIRAAAADLAFANQVRDTAIETCKMAAHNAAAAGMTEVDMAAAFGVNRLTVRRWLGK